MSADNGIYILRTPLEKGGYEYRAAHCMAIDNIEYKHPDGNPEVVISYFGGCLVFQNEKDAQEAAFEIKKDYDYLEYGISQVDLPHPFSYYEKNAKK